jgi:hypothetical protein
MRGPGESYSDVILRLVEIEVYWCGQEDSNLHSG